MIKTFEKFNELDPYGEENWGDDNNFTYNIGDKFICSTNKIELIGFNKDEEYEIVELKNEHNYEFYFLIGNKGKKVFIKRALDICFNKKINESFNELDPYGEENWNDKPKFVICKEDIFSSSGKYWVFHSGKEYEIDHENDHWIFLKTKYMGHDDIRALSPYSFRQHFNRKIEESVNKNSIK